MGYSLIVKFPDKDIRDKMLDFLEKNMTPPFKLVEEEIENIRGPVIDPAYSGRLDGDLILGFDFHLLGDMQARVVQLLCYWMVTRVPKATIWYDGDEERWGIPPNCDKNGFRTLFYHEEEMIKLFKLPRFLKRGMVKLSVNSSMNERVKEELERLSMEWEKCI